MDAETTVLLTHPIGLHARPAVKLAQLVVTFDADTWVRLENGGEWVKARSMAQVLKLGARFGQRLQIGATGPEADAVVKAVIDLFDRNFDEPTDGSGSFGEATTNESTSAAGVLPGISVSPGIALGITHRLQPRPVLVPRADDCPATYESEEQRLRSAINAARAELHSLRNLHTTVNEVIGVQISMLDDPDFIEPVIARIHSGESVETAWSGTLSQWIDDFGKIAEDYHRQRALDLRDLDQRVRQLLANSPSLSEVPAEAIVLAAEIRPSQLLELPAPRAIVTQQGSAHDHTALLARAVGIPMLISIDITQIEDGVKALVDADQGCLTVKPSEHVLTTALPKIRSFESTRAEQLTWRTLANQTAGGEQLEIMINVDHLSSLEELPVDSCDGIGLVRTEFLFENDGQLRDESIQVERYRKLLAWAAGRPVTIRTLDASADKSLPGLCDAPTSALGLRGIRYSLAHPNLFRVQLRALLRAAADGPIEILLPMVTWPQEVEQVRDLMRELLASLRQEGIPARLPQLGMMLEVPAAALQIEMFSVDFISVGSNDLTQYVLAVDRSSARFQSLHDTHQVRDQEPFPALCAPVLALIERAVRWGRQQEIPVSVCGEAASIPDCLDRLLRAGIRSFTVSPNALGPVKKHLATHPIEP
ncbi:MAG: HPr family phosphocarrier protein [Planctomycetota bacterium]|nr:HPr family phosphocarrier protein [Planctomycetota bacterium]